MKGEPLPITGDGTETRDWTYVGDIVQGLLAMGIREEAIGEAINLGSGIETRVIDMANAVLELTGSTAGVVYRERRDWDKKTHLLSCISKGQRLIGYQPKTTFEEGLRETHRWFVANWENIQRSAEF